MSSLTAYELLLGGTTTTGAIQQVASVGTNGQLLTSAGAAAIPTMSNATHTIGSLVQLSKQTASSSATISFTTLMNNAFNTYLLNYSLVVPATSSANLQMVVSNNNGSGYSPGTIQSGLTYILYTSTTLNNSNSSSAILLSGAMPTTANLGCTGNLFMYNCNNGNNFLCTGIGSFNNTTPAINQSFYSASVAATGINAIQLAMSSGNISTGTFTLYGVCE